MPPLLIQGFDACVDCCVWVGSNHRPLRRTLWAAVGGHVAVSVCKAGLGCRAVPTRCKYVPVSSRSPSMATRRSAQPCTPAPSAIPSGYWKKPRVVALSHSKPPAVALGCPCHDRLMPWSEIAPAFPTLPPSLAVGWHQRAYREVFTACRGRGIPMQRPALTNSHLEHRD